MTRRTTLTAVIVLLLIAGAAGTWTWFGRIPPDAQIPEPVLATGEDLIEAERLAREGVQIRPNDPAAHLRLAQVLRRRGRFAEAAFALNTAGKLGISVAEGRREAALLLAVQDWPPNAKGILQQAVRDYPLDAEVLTAVAGAYTSKELWGEAEPLYNGLVGLEPENQLWRFRRGVTRMRTAHHASAADDFRWVLARDASHYEARLYLANCLLGDAHMAEAEQELLTCRKQRPGDLEPLVGLAKCALERDDLTGAETLLGEGFAINGNSVLVLQDLAALYLRKQRTDLAISTLKRLLALSPDHRQGHFLLAQAFRIDGKPDQARKHEQRYSELDAIEEERLGVRRGMR